MKVFALGGASRFGQHTARKLAASDVVSEIVIAGRNLEAAQRFAAELGDKATAVQVDILDEGRLASVAADSDILVNTAGPEFKVVLPALRGGDGCVEDPQRGDTHRRRPLAGVLPGSTAFLRRSCAICNREAPGRETLARVLRSARVRSATGFTRTARNGATKEGRGRQSQGPKIRTGRYCTAHDGLGAGNAAADLRGQAIGGRLDQSAVCVLGGAFNETGPARSLRIHHG